MHRSKKQSQLVHHALRIQELLSLTFSYATPSTRAAAASVCKAWLEPALDQLWRELEWPGYAFQLLAPFESEIGTDGITHWFARPITDEDWPRFWFNAKRVRFLKYSDDNQLILHPTVFKELDRARLRGDLWPNLKNLELTLRDIRPSRIFLALLQDNLEQLTVNFPCPAYIEDDYAYAHEEFFTMLLNLSPVLRSVSLFSHMDVSDMEPELIDYLESLPALRRLSIPQNCCTSNIFTALAKLPELRTISRRVNNSIACFPTTPFQPNLNEGAFPSLKELSLDVGLGETCNFLTTDFAPIYLTHLSLISPDSETPETFASCSSTLAVSCKSLVSPEFDLRSITTDTADPHISYENLAILRILPNLTEFKLTHSHPVSLTNEELEALVSSWSSLKSLRLNSSPDEGSGSKLTLACLFSLAHHCPNLVELELYLDATIPVPVPATFPTLSKLEEFDVGISPINDALTVSVFLHHLCSVNCSVHPMRDVSRYGKKEKEYETLWVQVTGCLPFIRKLEQRQTEGEKEQAASLQLELQDLRNEIKMLKDQLKSQTNGNSTLL